MSALALNFRASVIEYGATAVGILINLAVIRHLGTEQYGLYTYTLSVISLLASVLSLGCFDQVFLKEAARVKDSSELTWAMFWQRGIGFLFLLPGLLIFYFFFEENQNEHLGLLLIAWTTGIWFAKDAFRMPLVAAQRIETAVRISLTVYILGWIVRLAAIWLNEPMPVFLLIITFEGLVAGLAYFMVWHHRFSERPIVTASVRMAFDLSRRSWPLLVTAISVTTFMRVDQIILFHLMDAQTTGIYGSIIWIMERMFFLSGLLMSSFFPYLSHIQANDPVWYEKSLRVGYKIMGLASIPIAFICSLYSSDVLGLLLGTDFSDGETAFAVLIWALPFIYWGALNQRNLLIHNLLKTDMSFATSSALLNLCLNILLIPRYGLAGAAVASVAGHSFYFFIQLLLPNLRVNSWHILVSIIFPLVACILSYIAITWLPIAGLAAIGTFLIAYTTVIFWGCIGSISEDYAIIGRQIKRVAGFTPRTS